MYQTFKKIVEFDAGKAWLVGHKLSTELAYAQLAWESPAKSEAS